VTALTVDSIRVTTLIVVASNHKLFYATLDGAAVKLSLLVLSFFVVGGAWACDRIINETKIQVQMEVHDDDDLYV